MSTNQLQQHDIAQRTSEASCQYLTFRIDDEIYGVGILKVREILQYEVLTKVPSAPRSIRGVMNLRGAVVPVVDLAIKFGLAATTVSQWTCIIIVDAILDGNPTTMGILADAVNEVLELRGDEIEPPPPFGTRVHENYLVGMGKFERRFVLILDIDRLLTAEDAAVATELSQDAGLLNPDAPDEPETADETAKENEPNP